MESSKLFYIRKREIFAHISNVIKKYDKNLNCVAIENNTFMITQINKIKTDIENYITGNGKEQRLYISVGINMYKSGIVLEYGQDVADYIWENDSLDDYKKRLSGSLPHEEDKHVFLYQNGKIEEIDLPEPVLFKYKSRTIN